MIARLLAGQTAQLPLAAVSLVVAAALIAGALLLPDTVDPPAGIAIAVFLVLNGAVRIVLWRYRKRMP